MARKSFSKIIAFVSVLLCLVMVLNTSSFAANSQPDSTVESISVYKQSGVLKDETIQLKAEVEASNTLFDAVEWSSDNPQAISCTKDGKIKGLIAGERATITCKAKYGNEKVSITVYCVERLPDTVKSDFENVLTFVYTQPGFGLKDVCFDLMAFLGPFSMAFRSLAPLLSSTSRDVYFGSKVSVCGRIDNYAYIRYGESNSQDGFVKYSSLEKTITGFLNISATDMNVWANGIANEDKKLTTDYDGDVKWTFDKNYIDFDEESGQVIGLKPGVTTITAKADGMTAKCTVHLLYKWPQEWVTETNKATYLYKAIGEGYESRKSLPKGTEVTVYGDSGTSDGWAFACYTNGNDTWWGHIPIADVSTKNTISYYNSLGWTWPMYDNSIDFISSPYAPRSDTTQDTVHHRGMDITTGNSGDIKGEYVVAAYAGTVKAIRQNVDSCGYCISISSNCTDSVTEQKVAMIYMHLLEIPKYSNGKTVKEGDTVEKGTIIGKVGKSNGGTNSDMGYHLHFETNNKNAAVGDSGRSDFTNTINPMYFYRDKEITLSTDCEAYSKGYTAYWYAKDN